MAVTAVTKQIDERKLNGGIVNKNCAKFSIVFHSYQTSCRRLAVVVRCELLRWRQLQRNQLWTEAVRQVTLLEEVRLMCFETASYRAKGETL